MYSRSQPSESADSETSSRNFELGIDFEDPADLANYSDHVAVQSELVMTEVPSTRGDQPRVDSTEITNSPSKHGRPLEAAEYSSVLAEILADYEELDDAPAAPSPDRSPFLPSIALNVATFSSFSADDSVALESPRTTIMAPSKESPLGEWSLPRERESLASFLLFSGCSTSADPWDLPLLSHLPSIAPEIENFGSVSPSNSTTLEPPCATVATPSEEFLQGGKSSYLENKSPGCSVPTDLSDPPLSSPSPEYSPCTVSISPLTSPVSLPAPLVPPVHPPNTTSPDIELIDCCPTTATAPESSSETPAGERTTGKSVGEEQPPDGNSDEPSSSTSTTAPSTRPVKYGAPACEPSARSQPLVTHGYQRLTVTTNRRQRLGLPLALSGSHATRPPATDAVIWALLVSWLSACFYNRILAPLPPTLPPCQLDPPAAAVGLYQLPRARDWSDLAETPTSSPVLDPRPFPCSKVALAQRVIPPQPLSTEPYRFLCSRRSPVFVLSTFFICFFFLFASSLFCFAVSRPLKPQTGCAVTFSISFVSPNFQLIFATRLCSLVSRATSVAIFSIFYILFISRAFLYKVSLWPLGSQMYFAPSRCAHFAFLDFPGHFCCSLYFSSSPFILTFSTRGSRYSESQAEAAGHLPPIPRSPTLATRYSHDLTVLANLRQRPVLLALWLLVFFNKTSAPPLTMSHHLSQPCQLASGILGTISLPIAAGHLILSFGPPPIPSRFCATYLPAFSTAILVPLASQLSRPFNEMPPPLLATTFPLSRPHQVTSRTVVALPLTGDKGPNTHWVHGENIEIAVNM